jgi:hypothetical protein
MVAVYKLAVIDPNVPEGERGRLKANGCHSVWEIEDLSFED